MAESGAAAAAFSSRSRLVVRLACGAPKLGIMFASRVARTAHKLDPNMRKVWFGDAGVRINSRVREAGLALVFLTRANPSPPSDVPDYCLHGGRDQLDFVHDVPRIVCVRGLAVRGTRAPLPHAPPLPPAPDAPQFLTLTLLRTLRTAVRRLRKTRISLRAEILGWAAIRSTTRRRWRTFQSFPLTAGSMNERAARRGRSRMGCCTYDL